ncbi:MAG: site-specific DNA-methyltransferase [Alkaliphilus sp.]|nr:site-specific DNA-methyltransferase [Alkaliphilus sp.]
MERINKSYHGDCLELMKDIDDKSIDMILCDLPYGTTACKWDVIIPFEPLWEQYNRIIKDNGAIVLTASQPFTSALVMSNVKNFKYEWIWEKEQGVNFQLCKYQPLKIHENILVFSKSKTLYNPQGLVKINKQKSNKFKGGNLGHNSSEQLRGNYTQEYCNYPKSIQKINRDRGLHPTQKPVALFEYLIKTYTNEGDLVLDNCAGSGTTAIAAINTNRNYILMEKEEKYCEIIRKRISEHVK